MAEAQEIGLELFARGQVLFASVGRDHVQVVELVAVVVACDQHAVVGGEIGHGPAVVGGRIRHRGPVAAGHRHGVGVPDAGLVRREQQARLVGVERGAVDAGGFDEVLDRVLLRGAGDFGHRRRGGRRCLGAGGLAGGQRQGDGQGQREGQQERRAVRRLHRELRVRGEGPTVRPVARSGDGCRTAPRGTTGFGRRHVGRRGPGSPGSAPP